MTPSADHSSFGGSRTARGRVIVAYGIVAFLVILALDATGAEPPRIGVLMINKPEQSGVVIDWLRDGLKTRGYHEPRNVVLDVLWAHGDDTRLPGLAREMLARRPTMIVTSCGPALQAIRGISRAIPVYASCAQMKNFLGEVQSMKRPGGATTGYMMLSSESAGKRLELLREIQPGLARVAVLHNRVDDWEDYWRDTERAASALGLRLVRLPPIDRAEDVQRAFDYAADARVDAVVVFPDATTLGAASRIGSLGIRYRILTAVDVGALASEGVLLSYGPNWQELFENLIPQYIARILGGTPPGELPIAQPTRFELLINLKTARALGLNIPPAILTRADRVIE